MVSERATPRLAPPRPAQRLLAALVATGLALGLVAPLRVEAQAPVWEPAGLAEPTERLFTPASGAFFARTQGDLVRSDDGGASWSPVNTPTKLGEVAVDPTNHAVIYATGEGGLYKTADDATNWSLVMPTSWYGAGLAVSPADPNVVYLALTDRSTMATGFELHRSRDGGATWERLEKYNGMTCGFGVNILEPHPTDPQRVFAAYTCFAGRITSLALTQSTNQGDDWVEIAKPSFQLSTALVGGQGAAPGRYYLAADRDGRIGGSALHRSDDDGATWGEVFAFPRSRDQNSRPVGTSVRMLALAYDPNNPDRVWLALSENVGEDLKPVMTYRVIGSADGGATWGEAGLQDRGRIRDLALGIDGANLYAATEQGVFRLATGGQ